MNAQRIVQAVPVLIALLFGVWAGQRFWSSEPHAAAKEAHAPASDGACPDGAAPAYWRAPMDPNYIRSEPGKSPMGMDLVPVCPDESGGSSGSGIVQVDSSTVQTIGVRTAPVEARDLSRTIRAVGRVTYDERRVAHVHTKVQGWVERLSVDYVGQAVERGQPLLEIYSPELVATQEELLLAARYRGATAESPFEDVKSGGASLFDATRRRLELWDVSDRDVDRLVETGEVKRTLTLYAPTSGVVTELRVRSGMEVAPNSNLYTIADLSKVWVMADVYEYELPWVELGQTGTVELGYLPGVGFSGPVTYISPFLDSKTRTAEVRLELPNPEGRLKPGMFGNILIRAAPRTGATAIPSEAVIRSGRRTLAIVALGEGRFAPREIELGLETGEGWTEIVKGVQPGEQVVVSSQFLIDSESKFQEAIQKLIAAGAAATPAEPQAADAALPPADPHAGHEMPGHRPGSAMEHE
jgi:Cu(I)/Ag(I) efflux system membrane fusion protein/cobalt-zinc-cadmium efflux system membrane fusion protein